VLVSSTLRDPVIGFGLEFEGRGTHDRKGVPGELRHRLKGGGLLRSAT